jgi:hypothetical protein
MSPRSPATRFWLLAAVLLTACAPLPPARVLEPGHLPLLQGRWEGSLGWASGDGSAGWPLVLHVADDGTFAGEGGGPHEVAWRGTLRVTGGRVAMEAGPYAGELTYHGGDGRRVLAGALRDGRPGRWAHASIYGLRVEQPVERRPAGPASPTAPVDAVSSLAWPMPELTGTYAGRAVGDDNGRFLATRFTLTVVQERIDVAGTWVLAGETAGTVSGRLAGPGLLRLRFRQLEPCPAELDGEASTGEGGRLAGHFRGQGCAGPVTGSFSAIRQ